MNRCTGKLFTLSNILYRDKLIFKGYLNIFIRYSNIINLKF